MASSDRSHLESLLDDDTYYCKCFDVYLSRELFPDVSRKEWLIDLMRKLVPSLEKSVVNNSLSGTTTLRCLGVGSGDGMYVFFASGMGHAIFSIFRSVCVFID